MVRSGLGGAGAGNPEQKVPKDQVGLAAGAQNAPRRGPKNTGGPLRGPPVFPKTTKRTPLQASPGVDSPVFATVEHGWITVAPRSGPKKSGGVREAPGGVRKRPPWDNI